MFGMKGLGTVLPQSRKAQKVEEAEGRRVEGNAKFAEGDYAGAIAAYGGELYVTDCNDDSLKVYRESDGTHVRTICGSVVQDPNGIAVDGRRGNPKP